LNASGAGSWLLIGFFFLGGVAFTIFDETRWIGIGQIWIAVAAFLALFKLGLLGRIAEKFRGARGSSEP
jgi:hypothetical protein